MDIDTIETVLLKYKKHLKEMSTAKKKRQDVASDFYQVGELLDILVTQIKRDSSINDIDVLLGLINVYKMAKPSRIKDHIRSIITTGYLTQRCDEENSCEKLTNPEPITYTTRYPVINDPIPPDLNTVWCENGINTIK